MYTFGDGGYGKLGHGDSLDLFAPKKIGKYDNKGKIHTLLSSSSPPLLSSPLPSAPFYSLPLPFPSCNCIYLLFIPEMLSLLTVKMAACGTEHTMALTGNDHYKKKSKEKKEKEYIKVINQNKTNEKKRREKK